MRTARLLGLLVGAALASLTDTAHAQCAPGAIGTARQVEIDTAAGRRFGTVQYPAADLLKPGEVVLTFDDGPHKQLTPVILEVLAQHCAHATFFMVGQRAVAYPALVREVARRGHTIGTHTWSHRNLKSLTPGAAVNEIELAISGVQKALGSPAAPFFRFPYLSDPAHATQHLRQRNTAIFSIDVDSYDFRTRSPTVVMRNVMRQLASKGGGIILFHDIQPSTAGALGALLSDMKAGGFRVVHLLPQREQVTLAEYDRRINLDHPVSQANALPPISQRSAWEPRVAPTLTAGAPGAGNSQPVRQVEAARPIPERPAPREREGGDDWRSSIFRGW